MCHFTSVSLLNNTFQMYPKFVCMFLVALVFFNVVTGNPKDVENRHRRWLTTNNRCDNLAKYVPGDCAYECGAYCGHNDCRGSCSGALCTCADNY